MLLFTNFFLQIVTIFNSFFYDDKLCPAVSSNSYEINWHPEIYFIPSSLLKTFFFRETNFFFLLQVLKSCDAHSNEYVDRLKDEERVMKILETAQKLLEKAMTPSEICRIYLQRVDHIYFKFDPNIIKQRNVSLYNLFN